METRIFKSIVSGNVNARLYYSRLGQKIRDRGRYIDTYCPSEDCSSMSLTLDSSSNDYACSHCGRSGDIVELVKNMGSLTEERAVNLLIRLVPAYSDIQDISTEVLDKHLLMKIVADYYHSLLVTNQCRDINRYLNTRSLTRETIIEFNIGACIDGWSDISDAATPAEQNLLETLGVIKLNDHGGHYDIFRNRLIFPIFDVHGNVISFGGRVYSPDEGPKYLNGPSTPLFDKSIELYGLNNAYASIRTENTVLLVEGYMDVLALADNDINNAVACMGTAFTVGHASVLFSLCESIIICLDGDGPGKRATLKLISELVSANLGALSTSSAIRIISFEGGHDPDSYIKANGRGAFVDLITSASPGYKFLCDNSKRYKGRLDNDYGIVNLVTNLRPLWSIASIELRAEILNYSAKLTGLSDSKLFSLFET